MSSLLFTLTKRTAEARYPRSNPSSTISPLDRLQVVYNKFQAVDPPDVPISKSSNPAIKEYQKTPSINLLFAHGNGMNKAIWTYMIRHLFQRQNSLHLYTELSNKPEWRINTAIAFDSVNHGDSAVLNKSKLGIALEWQDCGQDIIELVSHEKLHLTASRLILIGHSFGGFCSLFASYLYPNLFDSVFAIDPIVAEFRGHELKLMTIEKLQGEERSREFKKFQKKEFDRLHCYIQDTFSSYDKFEKHFQKKSFYRLFHKEVLQDMIRDELLIVGDKLKAKSSTYQQMTTYSGGYSAQYNFKHYFPLLKIPVLLLAGTKSYSFNEKFFKEKVLPLYPKPSIKVKMVEGGQHLLTGEMPDLCIDELVTFVDWRIQGRPKENKGVEEPFNDQNSYKEYNAKKQQLLNFQKSKLFSNSNKGFGYGERKEIATEWYRQLKETGYAKINFVPTVLEKDLGAVTKSTRNRAKL